MVHGVSCSCSIEHVQQHVRRIIQVTDVYRWILDAYVSDFFVQGYWDSLPVSWREFLSSLDPPAMASLLNPPTTPHLYRCVPPLSLLALQQCVVALSLPRDPVDLDEPAVRRSVLSCLSHPPRLSMHSQPVKHDDTASGQRPTQDEAVSHGEEETALTGGPSNTRFSSSREACVSETVKTHQKASVQNHKKEKKHLNECVLQREDDSAQSEKILNGLVHSECDKKDNMFENAANSSAISGEVGGSGCKVAAPNRDRWDASKTYEAAAMKNGQCFALEHIFRKHVKPKKQHEIQRLSKVISMLCAHCSSSQVVDVGAGLGHLSRLLTFAYNVKVTTVEAAACHAPKAVKFDHEIKTDIKKAVLRVQRRSDTGDRVASPATLPGMSLPTHVVSTLTPGMSTEQFLELLTQSRNQQHGTTPSPRAHNGTCQEEALNKCQHNLGTEVIDSTKRDLKMKIENSAEEECLRESNCTPAGIHRSEYEKSFAVESEIKNTAINSKQHCANNSDGCITEQCSNELNGEPRLSDWSVMDCDMKRAPTAPGVECDPQDRFVLAGLHACGDLTPTLLRVFTHLPAARGLAAVACCHMKLSTLSELEPVVGVEPGYPMSEFVRRVPGHTLSFAARELACHFIDGYRQRLKDNCDHLKIHGYRAAVQQIILRLKPDFKHGEVKCTVKNGAQMHFEKYVECVLNKLGLDGSVPGEVMATAWGYMGRWREVVAFYVVRLSLAPLVETLVLLDRLLYLHQHGISSTLVPIFEPRLSPRNFVLLASKS